MIIELPYGKGYIKYDFPDDKARGVLSINDQTIIEQPEQEKILIITSDHTRPVPSRVTMPIILEQIRSSNPRAEIRILIATGFHRASTAAEIKEKFGDDIAGKEILINHDSKDEKNMISLGSLPSGAELQLNSLIKWADITIAEGFIEPHFFAGFSGGRKSILPGIASQKTVFGNHCSRFIADGNARTGNLENNPIHKDMVYAAEKAGLAFILNVVLDKDKRIIAAFAGDPVKAHEKGCRYLSSIAVKKAVKADIVVTTNGGYPLDQNIYQAVKSMTAAEACVREKGTIITVAQCIDGHGGEAFYNWLSKNRSPAAAAEKISLIPQQETGPDQWEAQILARVLQKADVIMVADKKSRRYVENMHMRYACSMEEAFGIVESLNKKSEDIVVIPDGVSVIIDDAEDEV